MVNLDSRLEKIKKLVDHGDYFVINRARQYGKTTILRALKEYLRTEYIVISMSFQRLSTQDFESETAFVKAFLDELERKMKTQKADFFHEKIQEMKRQKQAVRGLRVLFDFLSGLCEDSPLPIVLIVDEVDQAADYQVFADFLGQLRSQFLEREETAAFHSVVLAGVYDIKNMKQKIRPEEEHRYNSPWNIAVDFTVDMSFSAQDISSMLVSYQQETQKKINVEEISDILYYYTGGYPFLVSCLCKKIDEAGAKWEAAGIREAVRELLKEKNTLFIDVIKNIQNHPDFAELTKEIVLFGAQAAFEIHNPVIGLGVMFGIYVCRDGKTAVSNIIFETLILNYFSSVYSVNALSASDFVRREQYIENGRLNMGYILQRFSAFMKTEYREEDEEFVERQGRLLFLSFLRPIINGTGHYAVEPQTRKNDRMDIQVFYGREEFIIELKIWHGKKYEEKGYDQLVEYLAAREQKKGYLLSFCGNTKKTWQDRDFFYKGYEICEVMVNYREKKG